MNSLYKQSIAELLGSFLVTFIAAGAICIDSFLTFSGKEGIGQLGIAVAHAIALAIAVTATMNVSGGFVNPAVTIALLFVGKLDTKKTLFFIIAQLLGAIIAGFFLTVLFGYAGNTVSSVALGTPHSGENLKKLFNRDMDLQLTAMATLVELIITFILTLAIYGTALDRRTPRVGGFGVGAAALVIILVAGGFTGAGMNPARYFGTALWEAGILNDWSKMGDCYIYIIGPVLGAVLAAWIYSSYVLDEPADSP